MSTFNFSVPADVKEAFNQTFQGENKSAVLTRLMCDAVEERKRQKQRMAAIDAILQLREKSLVSNDAKIKKARETGRP